MRETKRKKKAKLLRLIIIILMAYIFLMLIISILGVNIKNIYVKGNYYLTDQVVIDAAKLTDYPNLYTNNFMVLKYRLLKNPYIEKVNINYKWYNQIYINIKERKRLFLDYDRNKIILSDNTIIANDHKAVPVLVNTVPKDKYIGLIKAMDKLDRYIINYISDITYVPNSVDDERFVLNMSDGNMVYINLIRFEKLNKYDSIKTELNNNTGILNLDYGTNFEVKNW